MAGVLQPELVWLTLSPRCWIVHFKVSVHVPFSSFNFLSRLVLSCFKLAVIIHRSSGSRWSQYIPQSSLAVTKPQYIYFEWRAFYNQNWSDWVRSEHWCRIQHRELSLSQTTSVSNLLISSSSSSSSGGRVRLSVHVRVRLIIFVCNLRNNRERFARAPTHLWSVARITRRSSS